MIKIESITIEDFRGIRKLALNFKGKNFAICGPNGTGKSGVVDALEFALTGNISRLSGEGRGDVSLKSHAPHVDKRNDPSKAQVGLTLSIPHLKKKVTIERNAKYPSVSKITPNDPEVLKIVNQLTAHPEIVLSRRELIRYVLATPGKRNEEVQALLHLEEIEEVRANLLRIANLLKRQLGPLESTVKAAAENLSRALTIDQITKENILTAVNPKRGLLSLTPLDDLSATTSLKDGMSTPKAAKPQAIPKKQAIADIKAARESLEELSGPQTKALTTIILRELKDLAADPLSARGVSSENFYKTGFALVEKDRCPLCDAEWNLETLRAKIQEKINRLGELSQKRKAIEKKLSPLISLLRKTRGIFNPVLQHASVARPTINMNAVEAYLSTCNRAGQALSNLHSLTEAISVLDAVTTLPKSVTEEVTALEKHVIALPEITKQDAAREFLTIAQERLEVWREARRQEKAGRTKAGLTRLLSDTYVKVSDEALSGLYGKVQGDFSQLYSSVNRDDEKQFSAKLIPSMGKLGFDVDFYGRGFFPPGAYHSEGHQDGMGLCLYLALMRHLQGKAFTFAILDDVLMSVDTGHRREVCALLKKEFPDTQFIFTTHDPIWLRHMKSEGLISGQGAVHFRAWCVDVGPTQWDDRDVWTEIDDYLKENDVRSAAALLRHFLEYSASELCHRLRAPVEFRADAQYQLGETLPAAVRHLRKLCGQAKDAANSWNQRDVVEALGTREAELQQFAMASNVEQWQVNVAVHFNSWDNLTKDDFAPVVTAFRKLLESFNCSQCGEILRVAPDRETAESVRCDCGKTNLNLAKKKS